MADGVCTGCGAAIEYSAGAQSLKCVYCGSVNDIARPENVPPSVIEKIVPLTVTAEDLERAAFSYMTGGDYTPDDMLEAAVITQRERFYVPAYIFHVEYDATWTASFGYDREEPYTEYQTVYRDGRSYKEPVTRTRTVTDWRPQNGRDSGVLELAIYAGEKLQGSALGPEGLVPSAVTNGSVTAFNPSFLKGIEAEALSLPEAPAYAALKEEIDARIDDSVKSHAQGDQQKDWHWKATTSRSSATAYVPVCHVAFEYKGREYHLWLDGVGAGDIRADRLPEDPDRMRQVKQGFTPVAIATAAFVFASFVWSFVAAGLIGIGLAGAYGLLRRHALLEHSKKIRSALLTQKQASSSTRALSATEQHAVSSAYRIPEKAFFARTHHDRLLLPALSLAALIAAALPGYQAAHPGVEYDEAEFAGADTLADEDAEYAVDEAEMETIGPTEAEDSLDTMDGIEAAPEAEEPVAADDEMADDAETEVGGWSPSFDCARATSPVEGLICGSRELSALDVQMAEAYQAVSASREVRAAQVEWRRTARDVCADEACVARAYRARLDVLQAVKSGAPVSAPVSAAAPVPRPAPVSVAAPAPVPMSADSAPAAGSAGTNPAAIARMLQRAEAALHERDYAAAASTARNVLVFDPANAQAKEILDIAARGAGPNW